MQGFTTNIVGMYAILNDFKHIPKKHGVYIVGVNIDGKFCPLYVGKATNLRSRIKSHYTGYLSNRKEIFEFIDPKTGLYKIDDVYHDIDLWCQIHWKNGRGTIPPVPMADPYAPLTPKQINRKLNMYNLIANPTTGRNTMLFFNCKSFFDAYLGGIVSNYVAEKWHDGAIEDLTVIASNPLFGAMAIDLRDRIIAIKNQINTKFYYAYTEVQDINDLPKVELATKCALETLGVFTYACVAGYTTYNLPGAAGLGINIDLSAFGKGARVPIYNRTEKPLNIII